MEVKVVSRSRSSPVRVKLSPAVRLVSSEMSSPDTSAVPTVAQVPPDEVKALRNWLVQVVPAIAETRPLVEITSPEPDERYRLVVEAVVAKRLVVVAEVEVEF